MCYLRRHSYLHTELGNIVPLNDVISRPHHNPHRVFVWRKDVGGDEPTTRPAATPRPHRHFPWGSFSATTVPLKDLQQTFQQQSGALTCSVDICRFLLSKNRTLLCFPRRFSNSLFGPTHRPFDGLEWHASVIKKTRTYTYQNKLRYYFINNRHKCNLRLISLKSILSSTHNSTY